MILLISCYELGHQPLGLVWPLAFLRRAGFNPRVIDLAVEKLSPDSVKGAGIVCISVPMHTALRMGAAVARRIREINPQCHICFFGLYAHLNADHLLSTVADSVIGGESEEELVSLISSLTGSSESIPASVSRLHAPAPSVMKRLSFPVPERENFADLGRYSRLIRGGDRQLVGYVEASRGCLHRCLHCPITPVYNGRFFVVDAEIVSADICQLASSGAAHITFGDPDFLNGPGHSLKIIRKMHDDFPAMTFDFTAKIEHILKYRQLLPEFAASGCLYVVSAIESMSDVVLAQLRKGHTASDVRAALELLRSYGIGLRPSFVAFTPWTTLKDYLELIEFINREEIIDYVDPIQLSIRLLIPPGSALLAEFGGASFLVGLDRENFMVRWNHPDSRMDDLQKRIARIVGDAASSEEDPAVTFDRIRKEALEMAGATEVEFRKRRRYDANRVRPPRPTENWFCCAEPSDDQIASSHGGF